MILLNSQKLDPASKLIEIHNSHASYDKIQHSTRRKCISQKGMQHYHKKSWTMRIAKIHGQGGMQKFPSHQTQY
jgi:hypothetical protein